jgi:hypothetical protein
MVVRNKSLFVGIRTGRLGQTKVSPEVLKFVS